MQKHCIWAERHKTDEVQTMVILKDLPLTTYKRNGYCKYPGKDLNFLEVDSEMHKDERKVA